MSNNNGSDERMGEIHVSFEIEDADKLLAESIKRKIQPKSSQHPSIYKVSPIHRQGKEEMFVPKVVSIGPFYHGKESLQITEEHKKWYLHASLSRNSANLEEWVKAIGEMEKKARECYAESINLSRDEFIEMMLLDGCFILERFYLYAKEVDMDEEDPFLSTSWMTSRLQQDFILLENQIPFFILDCLFNLTRVSKEGNRSLNELVMCYFESILPTIKRFQVQSGMHGKHILDLIRNFLLPPYQAQDVDDSPTWGHTYSATDLWEAGVDFKKKDNGNGGLLDITFNENTGVLEIPPFYLGKTTSCLLQNLISLEDYGRDYTSQIKSYVRFMDILIDSPKDVRLLCNKGIMETFRDYEEVARVVNRLGNELINEDFYYDGLYHRVNKYCRTDWHKWRAILMHNYFNTPWSIISVVAAFIIIILTLLQTIFSILP